MLRNRLMNLVDGNRGLEAQEFFVPNRQSVGVSLRRYSSRHQAVLSPLNALVFVRSGHQSKTMNAVCVVLSNLRSVSAETCNVKATSEGSGES